MSQDEFFTPGHRPTPASRTPAIIGFLFGGAVILMLGFMGSMWRGESESDRAAPALELLAPTTSDTVENPVVIRFRTPADLRLERRGWVAGDLHVHAMVDDREIMPAAADITAEAGAYAWRLPPLEPGTYRIHLTWAARDHANLAGPADTIRIHIRD
jgi:hypothetical protein